MSKRGLGKGLQALIPAFVEDAGEKGAKEIPVKAIRANPRQPRKEFYEESLAELAQSIREHGVVQPILVRPVGEDEYELVAGERRWRACQQAGVEKIPAVIRELTPQEVMEISLIENLQREDLNPIEEAEAYRQLLTEYGLTQEMLAAKVGKSRPHIANSLRLLNLSPEIKGSIREQKLTAGHARALLAVEDNEKRNRVAAEVIKQGLSVRETEALIKKLDRRRRLAKIKREKEPLEAKALEEKLQSRLSTRVRVRVGKRGGTIEIDFFAPEELERIMGIILGENEG